MKTSESDVEKYLGVIFSRLILQKRWQSPTEQGLNTLAGRPGTVLKEHRPLTSFASTLLLGLLKSSFWGDAFRWDVRPADRTHRFHACVMSLATWSSVGGMVQMGWEREVRGDSKWFPSTFSKATAKAQSKQNQHLFYANVTSTQALQPPSFHPDCHLESLPVLIFRRRFCVKNIQ